MKTTLNQIRRHDPCEESWRKLLKSLGKTEADDTEVSIEYILEMLDLDDALWALRAVDGYDREIRLLACDYAEHVLHLYEKTFPDDKRPRQAIEVSRRYANGDATKEELEVAGQAVRSAEAAWVAAEAARDAACGAARGAAWWTTRAAWVAAEAARDAACGAARGAAWWTTRAAAEAAWHAWFAASIASGYAETEDECQWQEEQLRKLLK